MKTYLSGWGRQPVVLAEEEIPEVSGRLPDLLQNPYLPRGQGRSYGDAALPASGHISINTVKIQRMISFNPATGVLDAEAGATLSAILAVSVPRGYFLPVTPGTMWVSLGGALASNVHGKNHHRVGSIEHYVLELEVCTPTGTWICSRENHPELFRATLGGYGLTGFITRAKLKMKPIECSAVNVLRVRAKNLDGLFSLFAKHDSDYEYSVAWLDTLARGSSLGRGVLMLGNHATRDGAREAPTVSVGGEKLKLSIPFAMPRFILNRLCLSAFNQLFYRITPEKSRPKRESFTGYFYPLDRIGAWNLLYGKAGFFQYQCAIPDPHGEEGMQACLRFLSDHGLGAFLSVLKRCGDDEVMLPFCKRGYTLALDIPFRGEVTLKLLDKLDELILRFGGRVYLTKDARLSPESFRAMYPEFGEWMATVRRYNPEAKSDSRMAERLQLWKA
jgi:decaprenylphospho-beta-D-ribofuranose 2-oxidase